MNTPEKDTGLKGDAWFTIRLGDVPSWNEPAIIGRLSTSLADSGFSTQLTDQTTAWIQQLSMLRQTASALINADSSFADWTIALEYEIPRRGRRIDAVLLAPNFVIVLEFKIGATNYLRADLWQTQDYALDLRDFHEASFGISILPVLVATNAPMMPSDSGPETNSGVWRSNANTLPNVIMAITRFDCRKGNKLIDARAWLASGYRPTPTIVEATRQVFAHHNVRELSHSYADNLTHTTEEIARIIEYAKVNGRRVVCFVTGVPGSGKTLAGLTAMQDARALQLGAGVTSFMSGNGPLVRVLREALIRDERKRGRTAKDAKRETQLLIQNVHQVIERYGVRRREEIPPDHVIAFDEAQRAWHAAKLSKRPKGLGQSEPDLVFEIMSRPPVWSVVVALVGGGQEIHDGEAGLEEWGRAIKQAKMPWDVFVSQEALDGGTSVAGHRLFAEPRDCPDNVRTVSALHLSVGVRSPKAQTIAEWVNAVLAADLAGARAALENVQGFRLLLTRSLSDTRAWLDRIASGKLRAGLLACSGALRLRPYGLEIDSKFHRGFPIERWFLDDRDDFRSSKSLEVAMTEFECQGLELDYVGLCWGNDLTIADDGKSWVQQRLSGVRWKRIPGDIKRQYLLNKYRVLMTRAREGLVIWVPEGDVLDPTRKPEPLDRTAEFLRNAGVVDLELDPT